MSVIIDEKNLTKFIEDGMAEMGGRRFYNGNGIEDEGKKLESLLKTWTKGMVLRVEDTKYEVGPDSAVCDVVDVSYEWKGNVLSFKLVFDLHR